MPASVPTSTFRSIRPNTCALDALRRLIRDPQSLRRWPAAKMPAFDVAMLSDRELNDVLAYLRYMANRKVDGAARATAAQRRSLHDARIPRCANPARRQWLRTVRRRAGSATCRPAACPARTLPVRTRFRPVTLSPTSSHMRRIWRFLPWRSTKRS